MNKDLDERLVPQGEYRDALNVSVSYSEGSDVGALQNILGNTERVGGLTFPSGATCIGTVRDTENDKIYWFGTSTTADYIAEFNPSDNSVDIILCDTGSILNFSTSNLITGVAVLDGVLYFTDDLNEPRQVDIEYWRGVTATDFTTSTNLSDDRISLYRKGPLNAPTFQTLSASVRTGAGTEGGAEVTATKDIFDINIGATGQSIIFSTTPNYQINDIIRLKYEYTDGNNDIQKSEARILLTSGSGVSYNFTLLTKSDNIKDGSFAYIALLEEEEPLFELKFAKFAFRYKYTNGQFSTISPFSLPAFIPGDFSYLSKNAFNAGMTNTVRQIILEGWITSPSINNYEADIEEIEILYKDTTGAVIYIVESLEKTENNNTQFPATFEVKDEQVFKAVQSNQILRPFDSIPRKAKALEITGNRLIFGNYLQNFNVSTKPSFNVSLISRPDTSQKLSIKSNRTYQLGVLLQDNFGRQTPVFTDKSGVIKSNISTSDINACFEVSTTFSSLPSAITNYKYYIKETSNEYYNLSCSNFYEDDDGYVHVSFPSAEVNKVSADDYLILKKLNGSNNALKAKNNKFKVLDINNDPPPFLANKEKIDFFADKVLFAQGFSNDSIQTTRKALLTPVTGNNIVQLRRMAETTSTDSYVSPASQAAMANGIKLRFVKVGTSIKSELYEVAGFAIDEDANDTMEISFKTAFGEDVEVIYDNSSATSTYTAIGIEIVSEESNVGNQEYENKFFVKLNKTSNLLSGLIGDIDESDLAVVGQTNLYGNDNEVVRSFWVNSGGGIGSSTIVLETTRHVSATESEYHNQPFYVNLQTNNYLQFSNTSGNFTGVNSTIYKITGVTLENTTGQQEISITIDKPLTANIDTNSSSTTIIANVLKYESSNLTDFSNPPVFEVEPEDGVLDIYYETEKTYPISNLDGSTSQILDYANCFSFGNGVESDRIRDDFNTATLGKGTKVSTVFEDNYQEERVKSGLIFSQIYNGKNGINRLNQFIIAENITEEANPIYGSIQKLNTRDTDLTLLCDDKILKVPARKDLLFQADGNPQLTSTDRFLGTIIPYQGNYGCQHPESFADHIYRAYFVDKTRGKVLRLGGDGITEISNYGMKDYFKDKLSSSYNKIVGSYDENKDQYNVSFVTNFASTSDTVSFSEGVNGWPSRKSFIPEAGISLNNRYHTFKDGKIFSHDNETRNTFYGFVTASEVTSFLNGNPGNIKNFRTLNYQGDSGWDATAAGVTTNTDRGTVSSFVEKEGMFYNYIQGLNNTTKSSLDLKALNVQGLGTPTNISGNDATFSELNNALQVGDVVYNNSNDTGRTVTGISGNTITLDGAPTNAFNFFAKNNKFNTSGVLGYFLQVKLSHNSTDKKELYSVGSEVSLSS